MQHTEPTSITAQNRANTMFLAIIATVLVCAALKAAQMVFLPIMLAGFLAMLVQPPVALLNRYMPKWLALIIVLIGLTTGFVGVWMFVATSVSSVAERGPAYVDRLLILSERALHHLDRFGVPTSRAELPLESLADMGLQVVGASVIPIVTTLGVAMLIAFMLVLLLLEVESFRAKVRLGLRDEASVEFFATVHSATRHFQTYFFVKTLISLLTGAVTALFTYAMGIDFPFIWGTLAFLLNFIPNIGSLIAVIPPVLLALVQFDGPGHAVGTLVGLTTAQMIVGNFLDPRWLGRSLSLSPFVVFITMVFWGWMWGVVGIFLSVPLTILMRIVFEHIPSLRAVAIMMGDDRTEEASTGPIDDEEVQLALSQTSPLIVSELPPRESGTSVTGPRRR